jgi:hypothetical protein
MDFLKKAGILINHWIQHNEDHLKEDIKRELKAAV